MARHQEVRFQPWYLYDIPVTDLVSTGETIPIRLFLGGFDLTPTFREVNKKYSTRYYLSLVLIDEGPVSPFPSLSTFGIGNPMPFTSLTSPQMPVATSNNRKSSSTGKRPKWPRHNYSKHSRNPSRSLERLDEHCQITPCSAQWRLDMARRWERLLAQKAGFRTRLCKFDCKAESERRMRGASCRSKAWP